MDLSHWANGIKQTGGIPLDTARAVWHRRGARVASQVALSSTEAGQNIPDFAVGRKALNPKGLSTVSLWKLTNFSGGEPQLLNIHLCPSVFICGIPWLLTWSARWRLAMPESSASIRLKRSRSCKPFSTPACATTPRRWPPASLARRWNQGSWTHPAGRTGWSSSWARPAGKATGPGGHSAEGFAPRRPRRHARHDGDGLPHGPGRRPVQVRSGRHRRADDGRRMGRSWSS